jgi:hypothetical protein
MAAAARARRAMIVCLLAATLSGNSATILEEVLSSRYARDEVASQPPVWNRPAGPMQTFGSSHGVAETAFL